MENYADSMVQVTDEYLSDIPNNINIKVDLYKPKDKSFAVLDMGVTG